MVSKKSKSSFFVLLLSGASLVLILSLFFSANFDLSSLAKESVVKQLKLEDGESARVFCRGAFLRSIIKEETGQEWVCEGELIGDNRPSSDKGTRAVHLNEGQSVYIECPGGLLYRTIYGIDNEFTVFCDSNLL